MDVPPAGTRIGDSIVLDEEIDSSYVPSDNEIDEYASWLGVNLSSEPYLLPIIKEGLVSPLPYGWRPCKSIDTSLASSTATVVQPTTNPSEIYYFSFLTGESTWEHPCDTVCKLKISEARLQYSTNKSTKEGTDGSSISTVSASALALPSPAPSPTTTSELTLPFSSSSSSSSSSTNESSGNTNTNAHNKNNTAVTRSKSNSKFSNRLHTAIANTTTTTSNNNNSLEEAMMETINVSSTSTSLPSPSLVDTSTAISNKVPTVSSSSALSTKAVTANKSLSSRTASPPPVPSKATSSSSSTAYPSHSVQETRERLNKEIASLRAQHAKDIMMYREAHAAELEKLRIASVRAIEDLRTKTQQQKQSIQEKTLRELHSTESQAGQELRKAEENHTATLASLRRSHEEAINAIRKRYAAEERETERTVRADAERFRADTLFEINKQRQVHESELAELNHKHEKVIEDLRAQHNDEVGSILKGQKEEIDQLWRQHQLNLQTLQDQLNKEKDSFRGKLDESKRNEVRMLEEARELEHKAHIRRTEAVNALQNAQNEYANQQKEWNEQYEAQKTIHTERLRTVRQETEDETQRIQNECTEKGHALRASLHAELSTMLMEHSNEVKVMKDEFEAEKKRLRMEMIMDTEERKEFVSDGFIALVFSRLRALVQEGMGITNTLASLIERMTVYGKQNNVMFREPPVQDIVNNFRNILPALTIHETNAQHSDQTNDNMVKRQFRVKAVGDALEISTNAIRTLNQVLQQTETNSKDIFATFQSQRVADASLHITRIAELTVELETTKSQLVSSAVRLTEAENEVRKVRQQSMDELTNLMNRFAAVKGEEGKMEENEAIIKALKGRIGMNENRIQQLEAEIQTMKALLNQAEDRANTAERAMYESQERESLLKEQVKELRLSMVSGSVAKDKDEGIKGKDEAMDDTIMKLRNDLYEMRSQLLTESSKNSNEGWGKSSNGTGSLSTYTEILKDIQSFYATEQIRFEQMKEYMTDQQKSVKNNRTLLLQDRELWKSDAERLMLDNGKEGNNALIAGRRLLLKKVKDELDKRTASVNEQLLKLERSLDTLPLTRMQQYFNELHQILRQLQEPIEGSHIRDTLVDEWRNRSAWNNPKGLADGSQYAADGVKISSVQDGITKGLRLKKMIEEIYDKYEEHMNMKFVIEVPHFTR